MRSCRLPTLVIVVAVGLAACSGGGGDGRSATDGTAAPAATAPSDGTGDDGSVQPDDDAPDDSTEVGGSPDAAGESETVTGSGDEPTTAEPPEHFLANVMTSDGVPVPWPAVDGWRGDAYGQSVGRAVETGWYEIDAPGFAPIYASPVVSMGGVDLLDVELTRDGATAIIGTDALEVPVGAGVTVEVPAGALDPGTVLTVTELPARRRSAPVAPVDGGHRTRIFSFESVGADGATVQPSAPLLLHIDDSGELGEVTHLATFDPATARWATSGDCGADGPALTCEVTHFSMSTPVGDGSGAGGEPDGDDGGETDDAMEEMLALLEDQGDAATEELTEVLDAATAAARSGGRAAKDRLMAAIVWAETFGIETTAARAVLADAYARIAKDVVEQAASAQRPRCEWLGPLAAVLAQGHMVSALGERAEGYEAARELLAQIEIECRVSWSGTIEYSFPVPERWEIYSLITPGPGALYQDRGGVNEWREAAYVTIAVDPDSGQLAGTIRVAPQFVPLRFHLDNSSPDDVCPGEYWQEFTVEGIGSDRAGVGDADDLVSVIRRSMGGTGIIGLEFDGFYEAPDFNVSTPRIVDDPGLRIQTQHDLVSYVVPCEQISGSSVDDEFAVDPYTTQLLEGFDPYLSPVSPKVTLQDMLDAPARELPNGQIVIEGRRDLVVEIDLSVPFRQGVVEWRFETSTLFGELML